jgi:DNA gyrase subunit B
MTKTEDYKIKVLEGLEAVRQTAGMYIGNTEDGSGYHHMIAEVLDNSIDEFMAKHCNKITVTLYKDGSASVQDNGRGIPTYYMKEEKMSALEVVLTKLHAGGKFDKANYEHSAGVHGVGVSVVNALSSRLDVVVKHDGMEYSIAFEKGKRVGPISERKSRGSGTFVRFTPDQEIFKKVIGFEADKVKERLKEISYLCRGLEIVFFNEGDSEEVIFHSQEGICEFVSHIAPAPLVGPAICFNGTKENVLVDIALQWMDDSSYVDVGKYYTNNILNLDGGSHMAGFKAGLTRTVNNYITNSDLPKTLQVSLSGDDIREGLVSIVSIRHPSPRFSSQTKDKLVSEDARTAVETIISESLAAYFDQNPNQARRIVTRCVNAYKAREAARKARETVKKSNIKTVGILPGKLADCSSNDPEKCELFIVEGMSAGGSTKSARDRNTQAVLPLRGKVLNTERSGFKKMLDNEELSNLVTAIGCGLGKDFEVDGLRYGKVVINSDADVDGAHIRTLLLTFFFRQMPQLILNGNIFIAMPPLYRVNYRGKAHYLMDDAELQKFIKENKLNKDTVSIQRFKGLGEMSAEQLWETTMNPETRTLKIVSIENLVEADKVFGVLMGERIDLRKDFIISNSDFANLDL